MRRIITIIALAAAAAAHAQPIVAKNGGKWTPLPATARAYNDGLHDKLQHDMQFVFEDPKKPGTTQRQRWGVTGCAAGFGDMGQVSGDIMIGATPWASDGPAISDAIAMQVCRAAAGKTPSEQP